MAEIIRNKKPLSERPLKTGQATGASLATLGIGRSIPLMHGSQGCSAFAKVYLIQHFREPVPIQNTAIDQISAVMGGDESIQAALKLLCQQQNPEAITLISTGLTEVQGTDLQRNIRDFHQQNPEFEHIAIISASCPDFVGSLQSGFALTVDGYVRQLLANQWVSQKKEQQSLQQINVLCSSALTPADIELLKNYIELFDLDAIFVPDLSQSLDGHLEHDDYSATSTGGCSVVAIKSMKNSCATIVIGESLAPTGIWLENKFEIPCYVFNHLMGISATDELVSLLIELSGKSAPMAINRARMRLQDTLLDTHFVASTARVAMALESDLLLGFDALFAEVGCQIPLAVSASQSEALKNANAETIIIGDHSDLDDIIADIDVLVGNTHCAEFFEQSRPVFRAGYPCHDRFGNSDRLHIGYEGARGCLNELANILLVHQDESVKPYQSPYKFDANQVDAVSSKVSL
ncbi:MAG: nitrogenase iron-molybdenum cofactor biosynthesis protein NifN [Colwellia sp.]